MLVARAPMRISFAGGGTDLPDYYERHGGMVVSSSIDKYVYVIISPNGHGSLQISSSDYSTFVRHEGDGDVDEGGKLRYARVFLNKYGVRSGHSIFMASEMPPGTGLGSSSSLAVALTKALASLQDELPDKAEVARVASDMEINALQMPIGKQDQYAAAYGGLNAIYFSDEGVRVEPLAITPATRQWMQDSIMLFFTQESHDSREILVDQTERSRRDEPAMTEVLHTIKGHAVEARDALLAGEPQKLGDIMHRTWMEKKKLAAKISNRQIDDAYEAALGSGALGGKIAGAGGGGFLMLVVPLEQQTDVSRAMANCGLVRSDFHLDTAGARILVNNASG